MLVLNKHSQRKTSWNYNKVTLKTVQFFFLVLFYNSSNYWNFQYWEYQKILILVMIKKEINKFLNNKIYLEPKMPAINQYRLYFSLLNVSLCSTIQITRNINNMSTSWNFINYFIEFCLVGTYFPSFFFFISFF